QVYVVAIDLDKVPANRVYTPDTPITWGRRTRPRALFDALLEEYPERFSGGRFLGRLRGEGGAAVGWSIPTSAVRAFLRTTRGERASDLRGLLTRLFSLPT